MAERFLGVGCSLLTSLVKAKGPEADFDLESANMWMLCAGLGKGNHYEEVKELIFL